MDQAYKDFFAGRKGKRKVGFPKFKAKHYNRAGYTSKVVWQNIQMKQKALRIPIKIRSALFLYPELGRCNAKNLLPIHDYRTILHICCECGFANHPISVWLNSKIVVSYIHKIPNYGTILPNG